MFDKICTYYTARFLFCQRYFETFFKVFCPYFRKPKTLDTSRDLRTNTTGDSMPVSVKMHKHAPRSKKCMNMHKTSFFIQSLFFCTETEKYSVIVSQKKWSVNGKSQAFSCFLTIFHTIFLSRISKKTRIIPCRLNTIITTAKEVLFF